MRSERLALALALAGCVENHVSATLSTEIGPWLCGAEGGEALLERETPVTEAGRCRFRLVERARLCAADHGRFDAFQPTLVPVTETRALLVTQVPSGRPWLVELDASAGFPTWRVEGLESDTDLDALLALRAPRAEDFIVAGNMLYDGIPGLAVVRGTARTGGGALTLESQDAFGFVLATRSSLCLADFGSSSVTVRRIAPDVAERHTLPEAMLTYADHRTYGAAALVPPIGTQGGLTLLDANCRPDPVLRAWPEAADTVSFEVFAGAETPDPRLYSLLVGDTPGLRRTRWPTPEHPESVDAPLPDFDTSRQATVLTEAGAAIVVQAASGPGGLRLTHVDFDAPDGPALSTAALTVGESGRLDLTRAHFEAENDGHVRFFSTRADAATDWNDVWRLDFEVRCDAP